MHENETASKCLARNTVSWVVFKVPLWSFGKFCIPLSESLMCMASFHCQLLHRFCRSKCPAGYFAPDLANFDHMTKICRIITRRKRINKSTTSQFGRVMRQYLRSNQHRKLVRGQEYYTGRKNIKSFSVLGNWIFTSLRSSKWCRGSPGLPESTFWTWLPDAIILSIINALQKQRRRHSLNFHGA